MDHASHSCRYYHRPPAERCRPNGLQGPDSCATSSRSIGSDVLENCRAFRVNRAVNTGANRGTVCSGQCIQREQAPSPH
ncbi:hypothetical protein C4J89_3182 [Pseudomonas sp. R4-35-07]|nr:hypothetical protein C4J89_3182 [Pseudomonas sp. R4-35-07]